MRNIYLLPATLIIGVLTSHVLFTVIVHVSNIRLGLTVNMLSAAGYLTVPNDLVSAGLKGWMPAVAGALFFSLTVGAGLSLAAFITMLAWQTLLGFHRIGLMIIAALWAFLLYRVNLDGANFWATSVCLFIPLVSVLVYVILSAAHRKPSPLTALAIPLAGFLLIIAFWVPRVDGDTFLRIRDYLLLSNPAGESITRFYYQYTLYPAEVFKSLDQKLLKTCNVHVDDPELKKKIEDRLRGEDYLRVNGAAPADLQIVKRDGSLIFRQNGQTIIESTPSDFLADPDDILQTFSKKTDNWRFFRKITFISLIIASPFLVYLFLQTAIFLCLFPLRWVRLRMVLATLICMGMGIGLSLPAGKAAVEIMTLEEINHHLNSSDRRQRIEALKGLSEIQFNMDEYPSLGLKTYHRSVPERYWLAKALGESRSAEADEMLQQLLKDPHPNVVCMALFSLGNRKQKQATEEIRHIIKTHHHWYVQWYGYRSLRSLGWMQPASARSDL